MRKPKCNRLAELNRALNLVRPVGMNDEVASDWLASGLAEFRHLSDAAYLAGVRIARRTCTHHAQIVPTILEEGEKAQATTASQRFLNEWDAAMIDYANDFKPRLIGGSDVQQLISSTAKDLDASR